MSSLHDRITQLLPKSKAQINREKYAAQAVTRERHLAAVGPDQVRRLRRKPIQRPMFGSQEWAETRGDDLGLSADY